MNAQLEGAGASRPSGPHREDEAFELTATFHDEFRLIRELRQQAEAEPFQPGEQVTYCSKAPTKLVLVRDAEGGLNDDIQYLWLRERELAGSIFVVLGTAGDPEPHRVRRYVLLTPNGMTEVWSHYELRKVQP